MRYLFAREVTGKKDEAARPESVFCTAEAPQSLRDELLREGASVQDAVRRVLPRWLSVVKTVSMCVAAMILVGVLRALESVTPAQAFHNAPLLFWIGCAAALIFLACWIYERVQLKRLLGDRQFGGYERVSDSIKTYLDVPYDTKTVDVLSFSWRKNGTGMRFEGAAANKCMELWHETDALCLFDGTDVYTLPLDSAELKILNLTVPMDGSWNKEESPDCKKYEARGVRTVYETEHELIFCCALDLTREGECFRMLFPAYELTVISSLTGLAAPKLPKKSGKKERTAMEQSEEFGRFSGPVRPHYYWRLPKEEAAFWFTPASDVEFKAQHPVAYVILVLLGLVALLAPAIVFGFSALQIPGNENNGWIFLGIVGGFISGIGLFNLVAAWMEQYLGHVVTLICLGLGGAMMAVTWFFLL